MNFSLLKSRKREFTYLQDDVASGPGGAMTWCAGPPRGCDAALRPCGRAEGGPREAQEAHRARTRGRRPHVSTGPRERPCGVPRGRRGSAYGGPTG